MNARPHIWALAALASLLISCFEEETCETSSVYGFFCPHYRDFTGASTTGFTNSVDCSDTDTELAFRFTPFDGDSILISPNETVNDVRIDIDGADRNFGNEHVEFFESYLYPSPDIDCVDDGDCSGPFTCEAVNPFMPEGARMACGMSIEIETFQGSPTFDEGASDQKTIALLMDYSQTLEGMCNDGSFCPQYATDRNDQRISAAQTFVLKFSRGTFAEDSRMCVVAFGGEGRAGVFYTPDVEACMTTDYDNVRDSVNRLAIGASGSSPVWSAVVDTVNNQFEGLSGDRHIVLFTDGPDDGSVYDSFRDARDAARDANVRVHVLQLDNPPADAVTEIVPYIGPIDEYIQIACETGGSYQYSRLPEALRTMFQNLVLGIGAHYEVRVQIAATNTDGVDPGCYRVATGVRITMANTERTMQLAGDMVDRATRNIIDQRLVVCRRPVPLLKTEADPTEVYPQ